MGIDSVLVLGATGHLGRHLIPALKERGKTVHVLLRQETLDAADKEDIVDSLRREGAVIHVGDLGDEASLARAFDGIDAVISALGGDQILNQAKLFSPMKEAGIKRFVPSDFGIHVDAISEGRCGLVDMKRGFDAQMREAGIPFTVVNAPCFSSYWATSLGELGTFAPSMTSVTVYGGGDVKAHFATPEDIARVAAVAIDDPRTENKNVGIFPAENGHTQSELIDLWETLSGKSLERFVVSSGQLDARIEDLKTQPERMMELIFDQLRAGVWVDGATAGISNEMLHASELYPSLRFAHMKQILSDMLASPLEDQLSPPIKTYLEGLKAGDVEKVVSAFHEDYRSEQPVHHGRRFCGRDVVRKNHGQVFTSMGPVRVRLRSAVVGPSDATGVRTHFLELDYDPGHGPKDRKLFNGTIVFGSTDDAIVWGRLYIEPVAGTTKNASDFGKIIDKSREADAQ